MAKAALFIGWGVAIPGREQQALQLFDETMQYYGGLQRQGEIDSIEPILLEPHGGDLGGFLLVKGDGDKIARLRVSTEFVNFTGRAQLMLTHVGVVGAWYGEELQQQFAEFGKNLSAFR
jgi:hypothetical protein